MSRPNAVQWKIACAQEMLAFVKANLFDEVECPKNRKVVGSKWVFRIKRGPNGKIEKYKARLVAQGFTQVKGIDYTETFAPVAKFISIRTLLSLAAKLDLEIHQMDVKSAFLNGDLDEEIYMKCPPGHHAKEGIVWKLKKSLYELKQASCEWYKKVREEFEALGFTRSEADHSVFYKNENGALMIVAVYVNDMLLFSNSMKGIDQLKAELKDCYEMTDLGEVRCILNMEVNHDCAARTLTLTQRQYVKPILKRHMMVNCQTVSTPMQANLRLPKLLEAEVDVKNHQSALGSLIQHLTTPGKVHWEALMRVYRYLRGTVDYKLTYRGSSEAKDLIGFVDADHAGDPVDRRSITGYAFILNGAAVSWASKKQRTVATSSTEAEYVAGSNATKEVVWLQLLLSEIGQLDSGPKTLLIDNQSAIALAKNPVFHSAMKHIGVQHHYICEKFEEKVVSAEYVATGDQVADVLTKALPREKHEMFAKGLGLS
ncbi:hypothetical protein PHLCEN_2v10251 [Hermanssonia centrifuga]|uniref:Reverse transcriptase Ty1/copia-type domain-containing protein n=1 Tax=Hermanssonia centrifuga TaxID=98765 RepID=A0A2R6NNP3_9APHY|nr:hypothetical protein PHLCEN_2v10251 [Hermanssonia centrifuga]